MPVSALYTGLIANFSGSISRKGRLPVTAYRTDKWRDGKEGGAENFTQRSSEGQTNSSGLSASGAPIMRVIIITDATE